MRATRPTLPAVHPVMRHSDWMTAATEEYRRLDALLAGLTEEDWRRPTDCTDWDVRELVCHLVGAAEASARPLEALRQRRLARALFPDAGALDGMNAMQVHERRTVPPDQLRRDLADAGRRSVRARRRLPAPLRALPVPFGPPLGTRPLGYLMDCIYTRDAWMHRVDLARATGRPLVLTPEHDGRLVADVVQEWAGTHGRPFALTLAGPAGGRWSHGEGGEHHAVDAVQLCRVLSGRAAGEGLLRHAVPF